MRCPTSLDIYSLLCEDEQTQQGSMEQRTSRLGKPSRSWSSISTCDGLSDSSRCSEDHQSCHMSLLTVLRLTPPPPGLPAPSWMQAMKALQGVPQQVQCSSHMKPEFVDVVVAAKNQKPFNKNHVVVYFPGYDHEKHHDFDLIQRIIGKKTRKIADSDKDDGGSNANSKSSTGSSNMIAIYTLGKGIKVQVQGRGVQRPQIGWPRGWEVEELHIYCVCPSEKLKVKVIAQLRELLDKLSTHFHKFCAQRERKQLGGEKIEYNRSEPFFQFVYCEGDETGGY